MKNGNCVIGLFQGMFEKNILTFNPGWDGNAQRLDEFTDIRELQRELVAQGVQLQQQADETTTGPASFVTVDPDGNPILFDQHVWSCDKDLRSSCVGEGGGVALFACRAVDALSQQVGMAVMSSVLIKRLDEPEAHGQAAVTPVVEGLGPGDDVPRGLHFLAPDRQRDRGIVVRCRLDRVWGFFAERVVFVRLRRHAVAGERAPEVRALDLRQVPDQPGQRKRRRRHAPGG